MANINGTKNDDIFVDTDFAIDAFNGKGGIDTLVSEFTWAGDVLFDMTAGTITLGVTNFDTFKNIENLTIGGGADVIGNNKDNVIKFTGGLDNDNEVHAGGGNDTVFGGLGEDDIFGGSGNDKLHGGDGNDQLFGKNGKDILNGGEGDDNMYGGDGNDVLNGGKGQDHQLGGNGRDILNGGKGYDFLDGGKGADILNGGKGDDALIGGDGSDILKGGKGIDILSGNNGNDILKGGNGNDQLNGGSGNDVLKGGGGDDILIGGNGDDILIGGEGADVFQFYSGQGKNVIEDFEDGTDLLDLTIFGFADAAEALSHFFERGSASNDVVGFEHNDTIIKIKGLDLADIDAADLII